MQMDFTCKFFLMLLLVTGALSACFEAEDGDSAVDTSSDTGTDTGLDSSSDTGSDTDERIGGTDSDSATGTETVIHCTYLGTTYQVGDAISSIPGTQCNDCECDDSGEVSCVDTECVPAEGCLYNGSVYESGETFAAADGCNSCVCAEDGTVACTEMYCDGECADPAFGMFEPGCGGDAHTPVIEKGCYQACDGTPCSSGICQLTDINPCVCEAGMDCCAACGMATWLCLEKPETCSTVDERYYIRGGGKSFGECTGECFFELTTHINDSGNCATATLDVSDFEGVTRTNNGELTAQGTALVSGLAVELAGVSLEKTYGCPDCADGGAGRLRLTRDGIAFATVYDFGAPPAILEKADDFIVAVMAALDFCETTELVVPSASCVPRSE